MAQKRVSDAFLVNIGQLDHYVVFGTKSGGIQDFQRGKMCPIGVKQTPQTPPEPPKKHPNSPSSMSTCASNHGKEDHVGTILQDTHRIKGVGGTWAEPRE